MLLSDRIPGISAGKGTNAKILQITEFRRISLAHGKRKREPGQVEQLKFSTHSSALSTRLAQDRGPDQQSHDATDGGSNSEIRHESTADSPAKPLIVPPDTPSTDSSRRHHD